MNEINEINEKKVKINQSVQKTFAIIETMYRHQQPISLLDLANLTQLPKATLSRFLYTLMTLGYVDQESESLHYYLSDKFQAFAKAPDNHQNLVDLMQPYLFQLASEIHEAVSLSINDQNELLYLDSVDSQERLLSITQQIGKRAPLYCTGAGKLFLAQLPNEQLEQYLKQTNLFPLTPYTIIHEENLRDELEKIRMQQFSLDQEECELGVFCVATPVKNQKGEIIATMSVSMPTIRVNPEKIKNVVNHSKKQVEVIESALLSLPI